MEKKPFNPNRLSFEDGLKRIVDVVGVSPSKILTSKDPDVMKYVGALEVKNVLPGFKKWQLPVYFDGPSQLFLTAAPADAIVPPHSHDEGDGIRFIISGSILYQNVELHQGDWMWIPKGKKYEFVVGPLGASMAYCYRCCCA